MQTVINLLPLPGSTPGWRIQFPVARQHDRISECREPSALPLDRFVPGVKGSYISVVKLISTWSVIPVLPFWFAGTLGGKSDRYFLQCQGVPRRHEQATTLISGTVSMGIGTTEQWIVLKPGEQGNYDATHGKHCCSKPWTWIIIQLWKDGVFAFTGNPGRGHENTGMLVSVRHHYQNEALKSILYNGENQSSCFHPGGLATPSSWWTNLHST